MYIRRNSFNLIIHKVTWRWLHSPGKSLEMLDKISRKETCFEKVSKMPKENALQQSKKDKTLWFHLWLYTIHLSWTLLQHYSIGIYLISLQTIKSCGFHKILKPMLAYKRQTNLHDHLTGAYSSLSMTRPCSCLIVDTQTMLQTM